MFHYTKCQVHPKDRDPNEQQQLEMNHLNEIHDESAKAKSLFNKVAGSVVTDEDLFDKCLYVLV